MTTTTSTATDTRRRVKLYALNAERQWDDRGTGHVSSNYVDRLKGISLLVRAEADGTLLLESKIQPDTAYQKQQDTLIVWSEGDNFDLALSFQEKAGCDEIWEKICHVQGKDPSVDITQDIVEESEDERFEDMSETAPPVELPPCELSRLEEILEVTISCLTTQQRKDKLAVALENEQYIKKLLNIFHMCEDLENLEGLHYLYEIFKNIFLLNKNTLFEIMFADDTIFDVVGCLEYDSCEQPPKHHRLYLKSLAKFREVIPIENKDLLAKIHQTYRVQYIQDIILPPPSVFVEDTMLNTLSSFIFFNKVEIVTLVQEDEKFLMELFRLLTDSNITDIKRRDIVLFLKEFCNFAQNLQPQAKDDFYKTLTLFGVMGALEITLVVVDQITKAAAIDILTAIVEYSPSIIRTYTLQQVVKAPESPIIINIIIEQMLSDPEPDLGGAVQLMGIVRMLLDPENMLSEKSEFLNFFYKCSIHILIEPLLSNTSYDILRQEDYQTVQLLGIVLDLLSFCVEHHAYHMKNFIIQKDLLKKILVLMKSNHTFLVLCALRLFRKIIAIKDDLYNKHIVKGNLFAPIVDSFIRNKGRYNLLESAILELFEFIKIEDIKILCTYVVENFTKIFDEIDYVQTFKHLKARYDQHQDMLLNSSKREKRDRERDMLESMPMLRNMKLRKDPRQIEEEEDMWFSEEDDFHQDVPSPKPEIESYSMIKMFQSVDNNKIEKNGPSTKTLNTLQQQQQQPFVISNSTNSTASITTSSTTTTTTTTTTTAINVTTNSINNNDNIITSTVDPSSIITTATTTTTTIASGATIETTTSSATPLTIITSHKCNSSPPTSPDITSNKIVDEFIDNNEDNSDNNVMDKIVQLDHDDQLEQKSLSSPPLIHQDTNILSSTVITTATGTVTDEITINTTTATTTASPNAVPSVVSTSLKKGLVDYDADTDEEDEDEAVMPLPKKARIV